MKKNISILLLMTLFCSCNSNQRHEKNTKIDEENKNQKVIDRSHELVDDSDMESSDYSDVQTLYLVIADTGKNYNELFKVLNQINQKYKYPIDLMDRSYNAKKDLIALSENSEDEIYAGEYIPRRFPSLALSLEYLSFYNEEVHNKTIALVVGIFKTKKEAQSILNKIQQDYENSFLVSAEIYLGCIH